MKWSRQMEIFAHLLRFQASLRLPFGYPLMFASMYPSRVDRLGGQKAQFIKPQVMLLRPGPAFATDFT